MTESGSRNQYNAFLTALLEQLLLSGQRYSIHTGSFVCSAGHCLTMQWSVTSYLVDVQQQHSLYVTPDW